MSRRRRTGGWGLVGRGVGHQGHHSPGSWLQGWQTPAGVEGGQLPLPGLEDLGSRWAGGVQHHCHYAGIVRPQLTRVPPVYGAVHQLLAGVDPGRFPLHGVEHVLLVGSLGHTDGGDGVLGGEHVPGAVRAQHQAAVVGDVHRVDADVGLGGDHKDVLLAVVGPEVAQGAGHSQEGDLVDVCGASDWTLVTHLGSVPHDPRNSRLTDDLAPTLGDTLTLLWKYEGGEKGGDGHETD